MGNENVYQAGASVLYFDSSWHRAQALAGQQAPDGRPASIVRAMPYDEGHYELAFPDGEPGPVIVSGESLTTEERIVAGKTAAAEQAARVAAAAGAHAAAAGAHAAATGTQWTEMAEAARLASQAASE